MTEEEILNSIMTQIRELEEILNKKFSLPTEEVRVMNIKEAPNNKWDKITEPAGKTEPAPPRHIHSSDKILFLQNEILVLPHDIEGDDKNEGENIPYTKTDSKRLEKFLKDEAASFWKRPEKKCHKCSLRCEVCDLMNRGGSWRKCDIISKTWDAVTAKEVHPGAEKFTIQHEFQYRNDPSVTYHLISDRLRGTLER